MRVEVVGRQIFGPAYDGVDLLRQLLGLLLQLLMLLHTETPALLTANHETERRRPRSSHLQHLSAGAEVVTFGGVVEHPLNGLDLELGVLWQDDTDTL